MACPTKVALPDLHTCAMANPPTHPHTPTYPPIHLGHGGLAGAGGLLGGSLLGHALGGRLAFGAVACRGGAGKGRGGEGREEAGM